MSKKVIILGVFLILGLFIVIGCNGSRQNVAPTNESTNTGVETALPSDPAQPGGASMPANSGDIPESDGSGTSASIIVQSDNAVTDAEKLAVLNELQSEIDNLIDSLNNLEDASDSELTFE